MERLRRHERALLAIEILKAYSGDPNSIPITQNTIDEKAAELVNAARAVLLEKAKATIKELRDLNFNNNKISLEVGFDEGIISRAMNHSDEVRVGLRKLKKLVEKLLLFLGQARLELFNRLASQAPDSLNLLDLCAASTHVNSENDAAIRRIVYANFFAGLTNNFDARLSLPAPIDGALILFGPPAFGFYIFQIEGTSDIERLKRQIHELKHVVRRREAELVRKEKEMATNDSSAHRVTENRPKSAF